MSSGAGIMEAEVEMAGVFFLSVVIFSVAFKSGLDSIGSGLKEIARAIEWTSKNK